VNVYKELIESLGKESEAPSEANDLATVSDYMTIGREYSSFISLCPFT
jgi:hypothetical protein